MRQTFFHSTQLFLKTFTVFLRTFKTIGCYHILSLDKPGWIGKRSYQCGTDQIPDVDNQSCLTYDGGLQQDMMLDSYSNASSFVYLFSLLETKCCFHFQIQFFIHMRKLSEFWFSWISGIFFFFFYYYIIIPKSLLTILTFLLRDFFYETNLA